MKKLRSDSKWQGIPAHAREAVARWLFEDGMGYEKALKKAEQEFGIKSSKSSIARFYRHVAESQELAGLNLAPANVDEFRSALGKLVGAAAINAGIMKDRPQGRNFIPLVKLMLQQEQTELSTRRLELESDRLNLVKKAKSKKQT